MAVMQIAAPATSPCLCLSAFTAPFQVPRDGGGSDGDNAIAHSEGLE